MLIRLNLPSGAARGCANHHQAIMGRVEELQAMVVDGTITEDDLEKWP